MSTYKVMSLNMKNDRLSLDFPQRAQSLQELIRTYDPDLIGVQEFTERMTDELSFLYERYGFCGEPRGTALSSVNERCCVLYRRETFRLVEEKTLWLSDTPEVPGSRYPGSVFPRIVTWAVLEDKHHRFLIANTHLDHMFGYVRYRQCLRLSELLPLQEHKFAILTGDFNCAISSVPLTALKEKTGLVDALPYNPSASLRNIIRLSASRYLPIDHIFLSKDVHLIRAKLITARFMGCYPSDHLPVLAEIEFPDEFI